MKDLIRRLRDEADKCHIPTTAHPAHWVEASLLREAASRIEELEEVCNKTEAELMAEAYARKEAASALEHADFMRRGAEYNEGLIRAELEAAEKEREEVRQVAEWRGTMLLRYHDLSCRSLLEAFQANCNCGDQDALLRGNEELKARAERAEVERDAWERTAHATQKASEQAQARAERAEEERDRLFAGQLELQDDIQRLDAEVERAEASVKEVLESRARREQEYLDITDRRSEAANAAMRDLIDRAVTAEAALDKFQNATAEMTLRLVTRADEVERLEAERDALRGEKHQNAREER